MIDILIGATIFAIWYVTLFFGKAIGLSMLLFAAPFTYYIIYILEKKNKEINKKAKILIIPITLLSSTYFIYNNQFFNELNLLVIPTLVILMILALYNEKFNIQLSLLGKIIGMFFVPISFIGEAFTKIAESMEERLKINSNYKRKHKLKKVIKAIFITIPIVLVIIILLSSADEAFGNIFKHIFIRILNIIAQIQISNIVVRIILTGLVFIYLIGFFYYMTSKYENDEGERTNEKVKENFTIKMILVALNIVYLVFCIIQIKSLFEIQAVGDYSYYAREGFFQLMVVSLINLVTILIAKKSENKTEEKSNKYINVMCLIMILFTFIILISSALRMYFYEKVFGYTLLRLLVYCTLFTEAILLVPTIMYILDKKVNLAKTYFTIAITIYVCMNFANFDNIIAKRNVDRYIETGKIDMYYLEIDTSTDAINQIMRILENNKDDDNKQEAKRYLSDTYQKLKQEKMDFRDFNLSKIFTKQLLQKIE